MKSTNIQQQAVQYALFLMSAPDPAIALEIASCWTAKEIRQEHDRCLAILESPSESGDVKEAAIMRLAQLEVASDKALRRWLKPDAHWAAVDAIITNG